MVYLEKDETDRERKRKKRKKKDVKIANEPHITICNNKHRQLHIMRKYTYKRIVVFNSNTNLLCKNMKNEQHSNANFKMMMQFFFSYIIVNGFFIFEITTIHLLNHA